MSAADPDLSRCPGCGGPADNGHDREMPPNPYYCTLCSERDALLPHSSQPATENP